MFQKNDSGILNSGCLRTSRGSLKSVRFKSSNSGHLESPGLKSKKNLKYEPQDLFPDEINNFDTIGVIEKIMNQEMNVIKEEADKKSNNKITLFVQQY